MIHTLAKDRGDFIFEEDGLVLYYKFKLDISKQAKLKDLKVSICAFSEVLGTWFNTDEFAFDVENALLLGGGLIQELNINTKRGFKLNPNDIFDVVYLKRGVYSAPYQSYKLYIGLKINWKWWVSNYFSDILFYNATKPLNNLNYKTRNYIGTANSYKICFNLNASLTGIDSNGTSGISNVCGLSAILECRDETDNTKYTKVLETFTADGSINLGGAVQSDADTLFRITWTKTSPIIPSDGFWGIHRMQPVGILSNNGIYEFSSIVAPMDNNIMKPVAGSTLLKITTIGIDTIITECLIDYTKLDPSTSYRKSGRISNSLSSITDYLQTEDEGGTIGSEDILTEDSQNIIIE